MLCLRLRADHIQIHIKTFYSFQILWTCCTAHTDILYSALESAKQEWWVWRGFWTPPLLFGAWGCLCGCRALSHSPRSSSPCPVGFPSIKQAEALHSQAGTLKNAGTQLCNSPLYWTTPQGHGQLPSTHEPRTWVRSILVAASGVSKW